MPSQPSLNILGVIPARGGSKSIPHKNLADLAGKPLLAYTLESALASNRLTRIVLSTDDPEIADVGKTYGVDVPFLRPKELSQDDSPIIPVLAHLLNWLQQEQGYQSDIVVLLQPTSPFRLAVHVDAAIDLLLDQDADVVVSVVQVPHGFTPNSIMQLNGGKLTPLLDQRIILRRQDKPVLYARNGPAVLAAKTSQIQAHDFYSGVVVPLIMESIFSIDIDNPEDLLTAQYLFPLWAKHCKSFGDTPIEQ